MGVRAQSAELTHRKVLEAAIGLFSERDYDDVALTDVAAAAGVTVQTVLRRFGSKEGLTEAATALGVEDVTRARWTSAPGDIDAGLTNLQEHYEAWGEKSLRFLAQEQRVPAMQRVTDAGRAVHYAWVEHVFGTRLAATLPERRSRLRVQLIAVTDVYVWKIMRRDRGLDGASTLLAMRELVAALLA